MLAGYLRIVVLFKFPEEPFPPFPLLCPLSLLPGGFFEVFCRVSRLIDGCESTNQTGLQIFFLTGIITFIWVESSSGQDEANLVF